MAAGNLGPDIINNDMTFRGTVIFVGAVTLPASFLTDAMVSASAAISDSKLKNRPHWSLSQTGAVVAATQYLGIMQAAGSILAIQAEITEIIATGADRTVTVDLQKSTGGGAFATVLSSTIVFNNTSTLRQIATGAISSAALLAGDVLRLVVTVAGAAGNQANGLLVTVMLSENPA